MVLQLSRNSDLESNETDVLWTVTDVARYYRIKPATVRTLTRRGILPAIKIGKAWRYDPKKIRNGDFFMNTDNHNQSE